MVHMCEFYLVVIFNKDSIESHKSSRHGKPVDKKIFKEKLEEGK